MNALLIILVMTAAAAAAEPDNILTPGAFRDVNETQICDKAFRTGSVRNVPESERKSVFIHYRINWADRQFFECDHLCSLELGGSNDIRNLWPEPWHENVHGFDEGAKVKDILENKLHELVCAGQITLKQAQFEITHDWISSYRKHIGPFPKYKGKGPNGTIADIHYREKL